MLILGIDTSCDDTCISLIKAENQRSKIKNCDVISNVISSQVNLHAKYGGVYPFLAKREHQKNLPIVFRKATKVVDISKINLIGVTAGPGLEPCLWTGVNFAINLSKKIKKPLIPINHLEAHIFINFLNSTEKIFPAICLVVSGGHTILFLMERIGKYRFIGETRDDAAGECFDKVARILGLGYPGGREIDIKAKECKTKKFKIKLPRPMIYQKTYDFSFSGLKTAVLYDFRKRPIKIRKSQEYIQEMAKEVLQATIDVLTLKTLRAAKEFKAKSIILGGGVAADEELKRQFEIKLKQGSENIKFLIPERKLCIDNGLMIALTTFLNRKKKFEEITVNANLKI